MTDSTSLSRRRFLQATGGAAGAAAIAGCTGDDETPTEEPADGDGGGDGDGDGEDTETETEPEIQTGGTMNRINATMTTLDPVAIGDTASGRVGNQAYEPLFEYPDGEAEAAQRLAANFEVSDDALTYTFELGDAEFHNDGGTLSAQDVVYSFERLANAEHTARSYFILDLLNIAHETDDEGAYVPGSMQIEAVDDQTVSVTLERAFHATVEMLAYGNFAIHPENIVGDVEGYDGEIEYEELANSTTYGTGPFQLDYWEQGDEAQVVAFDGYREENKPYLDAINWAVIEEDEAAYQYAVNGNADAFGIPTAKYDPNKVQVNRTEGAKEFGEYGPLESGEASGQNVNYLRVPELATYYLAFDVSNTPRAVRQATAYVLNRREISQAVFKNRFPPAYHFSPPATYPGGSEAYDQHVQDAYPYGIEETQIDQAKQVMEDAGYGPDNQYDLTFNAYEAQTYIDLVEQLRDKLASAHMNIEVEPTQFSTIIEKGQNGTLQAYTLGWIADWPRPDNFLQLLAPKNTNVQELGGEALSYINWSEVDSEWKRQAEEAWAQVENNLEPTDAAAEARAEAYVQIEEANWQEAGFINLIHSAGERFWYDRLHIAPSGGMGGSRQRHEETWKEQ
jgi:peptide/nickel transport system substrate-binding protein